MSPDSRDVSDGKTDLGLSEIAHSHLKRLKEDGYFGEMKDAYKFAVALALAHGAIAPSLGRRTTVFSIATIDKDGSMRDAIVALRPLGDEDVYKVAERLAEWGVEELYRRASGGTLSFQDLLQEVRTRTPE
jgi:hypothetical protein